MIQALWTEMCFEPSPVCAIYSQCLRVLEQDSDSAKALEQTPGQRPHCRKALAVRMRVAGGKSGDRR